MNSIEGGALRSHLGHTRRACLPQVAMMHAAAGARLRCTQLRDVVSVGCVPRTPHHHTARRHRVRAQAAATAPVRVPRPSRIESCRAWGDEACLRVRTRKEKRSFRPSQCAVFAVAECSRRRCRLLGWMPAGFAPRLADDGRGQWVRRYRRPVHAAADSQRQRAAHRAVTCRRDPKPISALCTTEPKRCPTLSEASIVETGVHILTNQLTGGGSRRHMEDEPQRRHVLLHLLSLRPIPPPHLTHGTTVKLTCNLSGERGAGRAAAGRDSGVAGSVDHTSTAVRFRCAPHASPLRPWSETLAVSRSIRETRALVFDKPTTPVQPRRRGRCIRVHAPLVGMHSRHMSLASDRRASTVSPHSRWKARPADSRSPARDAEAEPA